MTHNYKIIEIAPKTYEIDEFDCDSIFVLLGENKALVLDTGTGVGDLKTAVESLTGDLPYEVVISHGHVDHTGGVGWFDEVYLNAIDWDLYPYPASVEARRNYAHFIAERSGLRYDYDPQTDIIEWPKLAKRLPLTDGQRFDLGGRVVTAYACPGHTPGEMVFIDSGSRILFAGDAINGNLLFGSLPGTPQFVSVETALKALERIDSFKDQYDRIFNQHHDYRPFGQPLCDEMLPSVLTACRKLVDGSYEAKTVPGMFPGSPDRTVVIEGPAMITFRAEGIHEPK